MSDESSEQYKYLKSDSFAFVKENGFEASTESPSFKDFEPILNINAKVNRTTSRALL